MLGGVEWPPRIVSNRIGICIDLDAQFVSKRRAFAGMPRTNPSAIHADDDSFFLHGGRRGKKPALGIG